jgi:phage tail-like protein
MTREALARPRDPLRTFQFRVVVESLGKTPATEYVAGCRSVSGLHMTVAPFEVWEGGNNVHRYVNPNKINWDPIVLEQGLALDDTLDNWARAVVQFARTASKPSSELKREVVIDVWDRVLHGPEVPTQKGLQKVRSYRVHNAWISKYHSLPKLDSMSNEVGLLSVELLHEGWELTDPS